MKIRDFQSIFISFSSHNISEPEVSWKIETKFLQMKGKRNVENNLVSIFNLLLRIEKDRSTCISTVEFLLWDLRSFTGKKEVYYIILIPFFRCQDAINHSILFPSLSFICLLASQPHSYGRKKEINMNEIIFFYQYYSCERSEA